MKTMKTQCPVTAYTHADVQELAYDFRSIDARKGRMPGLQNAYALVNHYYAGEMACRWRAAINGLIAEENKRADRNRKRRDARAAAKALKLAA